MQEALARVCNGTAHYSSARTLNSTEQPLFAATARALCQLAAPYMVSCYKRIYPEASVRLDTEQAMNGLKAVIQSWDQEQAPGKQAVVFDIGASSHAIDRLWLKHLQGMLPLCRRRFVLPVLPTKEAGITICWALGH